MRWQTLGNILITFHYSEIQFLGFCPSFWYCTQKKCFGNWFSLGLQECLRWGTYSEGPLVRGSLSPVQNSYPFSVSWIMSKCSPLQPPATSSLLVPNILLTPASQTPSIYVLRLVWETKFHTHGYGFVYCSLLSFLRDCRSVTFQTLSECFSRRFVTEFQSLDFIYHFVFFT